MTNFDNPLSYAKVFFIIVRNVKNLHPDQTKQTSSRNRRRRRRL